MIYTTEYLAVIIAAVGSFIIGFLWFGPLFGKKWMALMNFTQDDIEKGKQKGMAKPMVISMISSLVTAYLFFSLADTALLAGFGQLFVLSLVAWVAFILPPFLNASLWEGKSWSLFWLGSTQILVSLVWMALVYSWMA